MFTIFGATGNTGSVVARELLARGQRVRLVTRNHAKAATLQALGAEIFEGDVLDPASVTKALAGAEGAYFLMPPDLTTSDLIARNRGIVDGYAAALSVHPVKHAVLLSSVGADRPSGTGPIVTAHRAEQTLAKVQGTVFTFIRAAYFMENILAYAHPIQHDGVLPVFGGGEAYPFAMIATADIGRTAAAALATPPSVTEVIELSGPQPYSFVDAAAEASAVLGRKVTATPLPLDALVPALTQLGLSANMAGLFREMTAAFGAGLGFDGKGRTVHGTVTLGEVLAALRG